MIDVINAGTGLVKGFAMVTDNGTNAAARAINIDQSTGLAYPSGSTTNVTVEDMAFTCGWLDSIGDCF